jgi:hypothetical protein
MKIKYSREYTTVYHADYNIEGVYPKPYLDIDISVEELKFFYDEDWETYIKIRDTLRKRLEESLK